MQINFEARMKETENAVHQDNANLRRLRHLTLSQRDIRLRYIADNQTKQEVC